MASILGIFASRYLVCTEVSQINHRMYDRDEIEANICLNGLGEGGGGTRRVMGTRTVRDVRPSVDSTSMDTLACLDEGKEETLG